MAIEANIELRNNTDWQIPLVFTDDDNVPYAFTGSTFRLDVKVSVDDAVATLSLTTAGGGITSIDLANGAITVNFADFAITPGSYVYDLIRITGASRETLMFGELAVIKGVTGP